MPLNFVNMPSNLPDSQYCPRIQSTRLRLLGAALLLSLVPMTARSIRAQTGFPSGSIAVRPARSTAEAFVQEVLLHFDTWDTDHDGILSEKEVDAQVLNPHTTGAAAAAIAAIKVEQRRKEFIHPPWTKRYFTLYEASTQPRQRSRRQTAPQPESADTTEKVTFANFNDRFEEGLRRIQENQAGLFTPGAPLRVGATIRQGQMGDCFLLAVLEGIISRNPNELSQQVKSSDDGSCEITMGSGAIVHLPSITDGEVAASTSSLGTGRWLPAMEEAYGRVTLRKKGAIADADDVIGGDSTDLGGSIEGAIYRLTGHRVDSLRIRKPDRGRPTPEEVAPLLPSLREKISGAVREHRLVIGGVAMTPPRPPAISGGHVYTITGFDPTTDTVTAWNPHNDDFTPQGAPGLDNGYPTKGGVFTIPLSEFAQVFIQLYWEK